MKPNWYALGVFVVVCAAIGGAHYAHLDEVYKILVALLGALATALLPSVVQPGAKS